MTREITWHAAAINLGLAGGVRLGTIDTRRDWGYAEDYVEAIWLMLQQDRADDYVVATGVTHTVRECADLAFERGRLRAEDHIVVDESPERPAEVEQLVGDASKARRVLGWEPKTSFEELIALIVGADLQRLGGPMLSQPER